MSELCLEGQRNNTAVYKSSNLLEIVKKTKLKKQLAFLDHVERERNLYKAIVSECKTTVQANAAVKLGSSSPCSRDMMMHYSFDFAQQMHYPSPTRIDLFPHSQEMCLIWDDYGRHTSASELLDIRGYDHKLGPKAVISYVHHFFSYYGLGETNADLHNYSGQNKNKFLVWYFV